MDGVLQLANVPPPTMTIELLIRGTRQRPSRQAVHVGVATRVVIGERLDVTGSLTKRREP